MSIGKGRIVFSVHGFVICLPICLYLSIVWCCVQVLVKVLNGRTHFFRLGYDLLGNWVFDMVKVSEGELVIHEIGNVSFLILEEAIVSFLNSFSDFFFFKM